MKYETAKKLLLSEGYRIVSEDFEDDVVVDTNQEALPVEGEEQFDSDVYSAVEQGLGDEGFDAQEVADIMTANNERIDELTQKGVAAEDIVKILAYENCDCDDEDDFGDETDIEYDDVPVDEAYMTEGKSKPKGDKFAHKEKVAGKKPKGCCGKKGCKDCEDDDLDESIEPDNGWAESHKKYGSISDFYKVLVDRGYSLEGAKDWVYRNKGNIVMLKRKGYTVEDIVFELDGPLAESIEDVPGLTREPRGQVGTNNWDDFKDDFRAKTLFLKKALTPQFVSGIIKDTDFEVDDKEIKDYAFTVIEDVFGTKDPVRNLQARIRNHFVK